MDIEFCVNKVAGSSGFLPRKTVNLLISTLFVFLLLPLVSADLVFDNTYDYNNDTREVVIKDWYGLGDDLATLSPVWLDTMVSRGIDVHVGTFYLTLHDENYTELFTALDLIDLKSGQVMTRGKQYKIKTIKQEDNYITFCEDVWSEQNQTYVPNCHEEENGTKDVVEWIPLQSKKFDGFVVGVQYEIGVFVDVESGDYGDWFPSLMGVTIEEWATWTEAMNSDIKIYMKMDETPNPAIDSTDQYNGTTVGLTSGATGKIGDAFDFDGSGDYINWGTLSHFDFNYNGAFSGACWVKMDTISGANRVIMGNYNNAGVYDGWMLRLIGGTGKLNFDFATDNGGAASRFQESSDSAVFTTGGWNLIGFVYDNVDISMYINGSRIASTNQDNSISKNYVTAGDFNIGARDSSSSYVDGLMDECVLWSGNKSEYMDDLWNGGDGITHTSCVESLVNTSWSSWSDIESCQINDTKTQNRSRLQYDENNCGITANETIWELQDVACNYCSYSVTNSSWSSWGDAESCQTNDFLTQNRSLTEYDENYASCYAVTSIASDLWNSGVNNTWWDEQESACNYCSYSVVNSSWSAWANQSACLENDTVLQNRSLIEYDENYGSCYAVTSIGSDLWNSGTNNTWWDTQEDSCDFCTPSLTNSSWSAWVNTSVCFANSTRHQNRSLTEYDENFCGEVSNTTYWEFQDASCYYVPCINAPTNTSWSAWIDQESCQIDNTTEQRRFFVTYDANESYCGNFTNITWYEYQDDPCVYVAPTTDEDQWGMSLNLEKESNRWFLFGSFAVGVALLFIPGLEVGAILIFLIDGFLMLFSGIWWLWCFIPLVASVVIGGAKK